jgi:signal transduction histidine kinase
MNPRQVPSELMLAVTLLLAVHALLLWALLPESASLSVMAALFALTLAGAAAAFFMLRPLARDAAALMTVLPSASHVATEPREPHAAHTEELSDALAALHKLAARAERLEHDDAEARAAIDEAAQLGASFLASMGHDLRGPLNNIIGFADLLVMESGATDKSSVRGGQRASVDIIRCAAQDLLALLDQVIGWARLQGGPLPLDCKPLPLADLVEHVQNETERRAASRKVAVRARRLPQVALFGDRKQLGAALLALIDPSIRSGKTAEVELEAVIDPASELGVRSVTLTLRDRGLRVRDADQQAFFEAFRPSFAPTGQRIAGLGVGPALARALVRAHGGDVWLSSRADTGTTFTVTLPLDEPLSKAPEGIT